MVEITLAGAGIVALIAVLVQVIKGVGLKGKYAPLAAIALGIAYTTLSADAITFIIILNGIASGLASVGLYEIGGKKVLNTLGA
jgi:hypothetical protein